MSSIEDIKEIIRDALERAWDAGYDAAFSNERTIVEANWVENPYRIDGTDQPPAAS